MKSSERKSARHDHSRCIARALTAAEKVCEKKQANLTPLRRRVLEIVWAKHGPTGAYEILAELTKGHDKAAPPSVYRALEFLREVGLVHRVDALNAFLGCDRPQTDHTGQFVLCGNCHRVTEIADPVLSRSLVERLRTLGFDPDQSAVEIKTVCSHCATAN
jgi:Fur family transcriptional regulator, zinc uptake regulator